MLKESFFMFACRFYRQLSNFDKLTADQNSHQQLFLKKFEVMRQLAAYLTIIIWWQ